MRAFRIRLATLIAVLTLTLLPAFAADLTSGVNLGPVSVISAVNATAIQALPLIGDVESVLTFGAAQFSIVALPARAENNGAGDPQGSDAGWGGGGWNG